MDYLSAFVYGLIQGVTEFAPVSSSGHLAVLPYFMQINDPGVFFDLMMHLGTALAVMIYFRRDIFVLLAELAPALINFKSDKPSHHYVRNLLFATFVSVFFILVLKDLAEDYGRNPLFIAFNLIFFGFILYLSDSRANSDEEVSPMYKKAQWLRAGLMGFAQSLAIFPGVSRSGITISAGRFKGLNRHHASSFSFLLSLPIILAGIVYKIPTYLASGNTENVAVLFFGVLIAFIFGIITIHFFLKFISKIGLKIFFIYRLALGLILLYFVN
ncbi:MAG: undecaprenyl-diphosphate phosphatase [Bacteriovoracaceae bacterium]|nr:undecaprenyl-diphosphate phosphatase [Bacteriovoracaceae bacterium]